MFTDGSWQACPKGGVVYLDGKRRCDTPHVWGLCLPSGAQRDASSDSSPSTASPDAASPGDSGR